MNIESAAVNILKRGVELDTKKRFTEALVCYQEGLQILVDKMKGEVDDPTKSYLRKKIEEYMNRAEAIKKLVLKHKETGQFHEQVNIENNSTGHSYKTLFGRFLDEEVEFVIVEDPYIRSFHQKHVIWEYSYNTFSSNAEPIYHVIPGGLLYCLVLHKLNPASQELKYKYFACSNFLRLCELLVRSCCNLKHIELRTTRDNKTEKVQRDSLANLQNDLIKYQVQLIVKYSDTLHDRQIMLSSGWIIKIGRGLDFFKPTENKSCLGIFDMDLRQCHETTVDIVHSKNIKQSYS